MKFNKVCIQYEPVRRFAVSCEDGWDVDEHTIDIIVSNNRGEILRIDNATFSCTSDEEFADWLAEQFAAVSGNNRVSAEYENGKCIVSIKHINNDEYYLNIKFVEDGEETEHTVPDVDDYSIEENVPLA